MQLKETEKSRQIKEIWSAGVFWGTALLFVLAGILGMVWGYQTEKALDASIFLSCGSLSLLLAGVQLFWGRQRAIWWWKTPQGHWEAKEEFPSGASGIILGFFPYRLFGQRVEVYYHGGSKWCGSSRDGFYVIEQSNGGERTADPERIKGLIPDEIARELLRVSTEWESESLADFSELWGVPYHIRPISCGSQVLARWRGEQIVFSDPDELVQLLVRGWVYYTHDLQNWLNEQNRPRATLENLPDLFVGLKRADRLTKTPQCLLQVICDEVRQIAGHLAQLEKGSSHDTLAADVCGLVAAWQDISTRAAKASLSPGCAHPREVIIDLRQRLDLTASCLRDVLAEIRVDKRFAHSQRGRELEASLVLALNDIIPSGDEEARRSAGILKETVGAARTILEDRSARAASAGTAPTAPTEPAASVVVSAGLAAQAAVLTERPAK